MGPLDRSGQLRRRGKSISNFIALAVHNAVAFSKIEQQNHEIKEKTNLLEATIQNISEIVELRTAVIETQNKELETLSIVAKETNNAIMLMDAKANIALVFNSAGMYRGFRNSEGESEIAIYGVNS